MKLMQRSGITWMGRIISSSRTVKGCRNIGAQNPKLSGKPVLMVAATRLTPFGHAHCVPCPWLPAIVTLPAEGCLGLSPWTASGILRAESGFKKYLTRVGSPNRPLPWRPPFRLWKSPPLLPPPPLRPPRNRKKVLVSKY